jgi:hypothetical protein
VKYLFLFSFLIVSFVSFGQKYELGVNVGSSNYIGDLSPRLALRNSREAFGIFAKKNLTKFWSFRLSYNFARIAAADSNFNYNKLRNLSFTNNLNEIGGMFEFNYRPYAIGNIPNKSTFYIMIGMAVTIHNPQSTYQGVTYNLKELKTEGQGKPYPGFVIAMPMGIGYKWDVTRTFIISAEIGFRLAFSDYLDDVSGNYPDLNGKLPIAAHMSDRSVEKNDVPLSSYNKQRGDANPVDWYVISGIHFAYRLKPSPCYHF